MDTNTRKQIDRDYERAGSPLRVDVSPIEPIQPISIGLLLLAIFVRLSPWIAATAILCRLSSLWVQP